ncbi:MAG: hypothetical protein ACOX6T_03535 [Myxococcales bacterium]|jgi:hypothetical protein
MNIVTVAKQAIRVVWRHKYLWFFGFFLAGGAGGGGARRAEPAATGNGQNLPAWLIPLLASMLVVALVALVMHVVSEAAVIEGVRRHREGRPFGTRAGFGVGFRHFWRVLGIKLLAALAFLVIGVTIVAPTLLAVFEVIPLWLGIPATVLLALLAIPVGLSFYFVYLYALRFAVLEGAPPIDAVRAAIAWLHGRVLVSLQLLLAWGVGAFAGGIAAFVALLPAAAIGIALYFLAGLIPAIVVALVLLLPVLVPIAGITGAYGSAVWTLGFLDEQRAA